MTILTCAEVPEANSGDANGVETNDDRHFIVSADNGHESIYTIIASSVFRTAVSGGFDPYLYVHPVNPYAYMKKVSYKAGQGKNWYDVQCHYDSKPITREDREKGKENPCDRRAKYRWDKRKQTAIRFHDVDGKAILNTAGEFFDPPPEKEETIWLFRVEKNLPEIPLWLIGYEDSVNDADLPIFGGLTIPKRCGRFVIDDLGTEQEENGFTFFPLKFTLELRKSPTAFVTGGTPNIRDGNDPPTPFTPTGWALIALNQGLKEKAYVGSTDRINMKDDNGDDVTSPLPLDENGQRLLNPSPTTCLFVAWRQFDDADYSILPVNES